MDGSWVLDAQTKPLLVPWVTMRDRFPSHLHMPMSTLNIHPIRRVRVPPPPTTPVARAVLGQAQWTVDSGRGSGHRRLKGEFVLCACARATRTSKHLAPGHLVPEPNQAIKKSRAI